MRCLHFRTFILSRAFIAGSFLALVGAIAGISGSASASGTDAPPRSAKGAASEWPQWRGPNRDGISPDSGLLQDWDARPPKLLWTAEGLGGGYASVSIVADRIYTTGNLPSGQAVVCVGAADGKVLWKSPLTSTVPRHGYPGTRCTPSIDGDRLYAIATSGKLACVNLADGSEVWSKEFAPTWHGKMMSGWGYSESPLVDGDRVLCTPGADDAMIVALNKTTGSEIWRATGPQNDSKGKAGAAYSSIVISNACGVKQYVQLVGRGVIGVRASDGKFLWEYNNVANGTANIPTPLVSGDYVFCSTGYGAGAALLKLVKEGRDGVRCEEQYFLPGSRFQNHHGQMILKDGFVYCGSGHNKGLPICLEMESGKIAWGGTKQGPGSDSAAVCYADGHVIFRYGSGEVALIEATPSSYNLKGSFKPDYIGPERCWSHPVVVNGRLYLRDQDKLMCYDVRSH